MNTSRMIVAIAFILVGLLWMMWNFNLVNLSWIWEFPFNKVVWPSLVIILGINILMGALKKGDDEKKNDTKTI